MKAIQGALLLQASSPAYDRLGATALAGLLCALVTALVAAVVIDSIYSAGLRRLMQRWLVKDWLKANFRRRRREKPETASAPSLTVSGEPSTGPSSSASPSYRNGRGVDADREAAEQTIVSVVRLATAGRERSLFALPYRQLCGQLATAMQAESALPLADRRRLIAGFAPSLDPAWCDRVLKGEVPDASHLPYGEDVGSPKSESSGRLLEAQQFLLFQLERGLDDLQSYLTTWWLGVDVIAGLIVASWLIALFFQLALPAGSPWPPNLESTARAYLWVLTIITVLMVPFMRRLVGRLWSAVG